MQPSRMNVAALPNCPNGLPTAIAVPAEKGETLIGGDATDVEESSFLRMRNWKMLLGKSKAELQAELATNTDLSKLLSKMSLEELATEYFQKMLQETIEDQPEIASRPQVIMGIPPAASDVQLRWRSNYKKQIESIFQKMGYPKPKFFPEPFAVFQYHWNNGEIEDNGKQQNVFIVDIGGGTTDVCLIQTTHHGRLARGGINHVPHGVKSVEIGGATLDQCLAEELGLDGTVTGIQQQIKSVREHIFQPQKNQKGLSKQEPTTFERDGHLVSVNDALVKRVFRNKVWPAIAETLQESFDDTRQKQITVDKVHIVILAGGTCQMGFVQELVKSKLCELNEFLDSTFIVSPDYQSAVSHGLAIEAAANSLHHGMMPSRISAFLQEHLKFECGHLNGDLYKPLNVKSKYKSQGDFGRGILLRAPQELNRLMNRTRTWQFSLKQDSRELYYRFCKTNESSDEEELCNSWQRIARYRHQRPKRRLDLSMTLKDDGFATFEIETSEGIRYELEPPVDLHDLSGLEGDNFFAIDFGTDNTQLAYVSIKDPDLLQPLPTHYTWDPTVELRCEQLVNKLDSILGSKSERADILQAINKEALTDYVYHSNRIEGSELNRGQTEKLLEKSGNTEFETRESLLRVISNLGVIGEDGSIVSGKMIKDCGAAENLKNGFNLVWEQSRDSERPLHTTMIREIHQRTMQDDDEAGPGRFRTNNVEIQGTTFVPPDHTQVPQLCEQLLQRINSEEFVSLNPILQAVEAHARFVSIHPFSDGNGRVARLLANYFMWRRDLPGFLLPWENRELYYDALEECNSKEPVLMGNITDLAKLFCDVLEDTVERFEQRSSQAEESVEKNPVIDVVDGDSEFGRLIESLSPENVAAVPLNFEEQYEDWFSTMSSVVSDLKELSGQLSRAFRSSRKGEVLSKVYPLVGIDTYSAICERKSFDRTWCLRITFEIGDDEEELVFHFGPNSKQAEELNADLKCTCSLHISRLVPEELRHVRVSDSDWSRVIEITHDGSKLGVLLRDKSTGELEHVLNQNSLVENWFGILVQDLLGSRS